MKYIIKVYLPYIMLIILWQSLEGCSPKKPKQPQLSIEQMLGQTFMISFNGTTPSSMIREWIIKRKLGGVALFGKNAKDTKQLRKLIHDLQRIAQKANVAPLFIATDHEPGSFMSIRTGKTFPNLATINKKKLPPEPIIHAMISDLKNWGFNMNFHPVLDLRNPKIHSALNYRIYSSNLQTMKQWAKLNTDLFNQAKILAVAKHFPGHGSTTTDSHFKLPVIRKPLSKLNQQDLSPFRSAIDNHVPAIMASHILFPELDKTYPASMSYNILTGLLRNKMNFQGLIITDDIAMGAIKKNYDLPFAAYKMLQAGNDIILITRHSKGKNKTKNIYKYLLQKCKTDPAFLKQVRAAYHRIIAYKQKYNIMHQQGNFQ